MNVYERSLTFTIAMSCLDAVIQRNNYPAIPYLPHEPPGSSDQEDDEGQGHEDGEDGDHSVIVRHSRIVKTVWNRIKYSHCNYSFDNRAVHGHCIASYAKLTDTHLTNCQYISYMNSQLQLTSHSLLIPKTSLPNIFESDYYV